MDRALCCSHPLIDTVLAQHAVELAGDREGYRNHIYRVLNFYLRLSGLQPQEVPLAVAIAAAFHDIAMWTEGTFDYLEPSAEAAAAYVLEHGLAAIDIEHVRELIVQHHKLSKYGAPQPWQASVEAWRQADLVDVSFGLARAGLPWEFVRHVQKTLPDRGFHLKLLKLTARELVRRPWRPLPMMRL